MAEPFTIFVTRNDYPSAGIELLKKRCEVDMWEGEREIPRDELLKRVQGKDAIFVCSHQKIDSELICAAGPKLKMVSTCSVGVDHVDLPAVKEAGLKLGYTPGVLTEAVAELTITLLLAATRRIFEANKAISEKTWEWTPTWMCGRGLAGSTVGIYGFGRIGQSVAEKLKAFNVFRILYSGPRRKKEGDELGAEFVDLNTLLRESDAVIVLCPLTPETKGLFTLEKFSMMKKSAVFVNTARGAIVDQDGLVTALQKKLIRAAGLDVMTPEPLPHDHPLVTLDNCVLTPHIGSATLETRDDMCLLAANNILAFMDGKDLPAEYKL